MIPGKDGALSVRSASPYQVKGHIVVNDTCDHGWTAVWASEMGDTPTLQGLLTHADRYMSPTWRDGGLYYPRNDAAQDADGNCTLVEPLTGNALLAYARLNVPDGLWHLYNQPWDRSHFDEPALTRVASDLDVTQAVFDDQAGTLSFTLQRRHDRHGDGAVLLSNTTGRGVWTLQCDGHDVAHGNNEAVDVTGRVDVDREVDGLVLHCPEGGPHGFTMAFAGRVTGTRQP